MKSGAEWYKREPVAYLGGVQGLTAKEHAVYSVSLELIYLHGGSINNDPGWIAGWIKDMGSHAVRKTIISLIEKGKLYEENGQLTQKRAKTQAKTKENVREKRVKSGEKGGINSGKSRRENSKNNNLGEANASTREEKRREEKIYGVDGGSAREHDPPISQDVPTERELILEAMGCDPSGVTGRGGGVIGRMSDMQMVAAWKSELGLTQQEIITVIREVMAGKPDPGPPSTFRYFEKAMCRFAGDKDRVVKLQPIRGQENAKHSSNGSGAVQRNQQSRATAGLAAGFSRALDKNRSGG